MYYNNNAFVCWYLGTVSHALFCCNQKGPVEQFGIKIYKKSLLSGKKSKCEA